MVARTAALALWVVFVVLFFVLGLAPGAARAHSCHSSPEDGEGVGRGLRFSTAILLAEYAGPRYEGSYQGLGTALAWEHRRVALLASLSGYRLVRNGAEAWGPGDLLLGAQAPILRRGGGALGVALMATLPTGDPDKGLGMGHVMLMPALYGTLRTARVALGGSAGYAVALADPGAPGGHHHAGPSPLVDPMNPMELTAGLGAALLFHALLDLYGDLRGALPVALPGEARLIAAVGGRVRLRAFSVGLEGQVPLVGAPFRARGVMTVSYNL